MADSLTPFLGLTKPIVGDPDGEDLWGEKTNANWDKVDLFASQQGALVEAPQDNKLYGRGTPTRWQETIFRAEFTAVSDKVTQNQTDIDSLEAANAAQDIVINGKAPLGPNDGAIYGWKGTTWFDITTSMTVTWDQITGKPATFPPTLPIPSSGVTGLDTKQASQDAAIAAINWNSLSGKPTTYPPDPHNHPISQVTGLQGALDAKEPIIASGNASYFWAGDKTWKPVPAAGIGEAPGDGQLYSRKGSTASWVVASAGAVVSDTPPVGMPISTIWWNSANGGLFIDYQDPNTRQWVMVNAPGMPEANKDGKPYARKDGGWFDLTATLAAKADDTDLANYLPLTGGTLSGVVNSSAAIQVTAALASGYCGYFSNTNTTGGGAIGYSGTIYGIIGHAGQYSLYGNGNVYASGSAQFGGGGTFGGQISTNAGLTVNAAIGFTNITNMSIGYGNACMWTVASNYNFEFAFSATTHYRMETNIFRSLQDNNKSMGASSYRWTTVYAVTGTINTSDEREKQDIAPLTEAELRCARALRPLIVTYRWKHSVEEKGEAARTHTGVIAQRIKEVFDAEGLDVAKYGFWCADPIMVWHHAVYDEDPDTKEVTTREEGWEEDTGEIRYGVRYDELAMFILAGL